MVGHDSDVFLDKQDVVDFVFAPDRIRLGFVVNPGEVGKSIQWNLMIINGTLILFKTKQLLLQIHAYYSLVPSPTIEAKDRLQYLATKSGSRRDTVSDL